MCSYIHKGSLTHQYVQGSETVIEERPARPQTPRPFGEPLLTAGDLSWISPEGMRAVLRVKYGSRLETAAIAGFESVYERDRLVVGRLKRQIETEYRASGASANGGVGRPPSDEFLSSRERADLVLRRRAREREVYLDLLAGL